MSDVERTVEEAVRRSAERADEPSLEDAAAAIRRGRTRRRIRTAGTGAIAMVIAAAVAAPIVWLAPLGFEKVPITGPTPSPSPADVAPPPDGPPFHPATYREGDMTVLPLTFPDGSTAELVYPSGINLETGVIQPEGYLDGGPRDCQGNMIVSRSNLAGEVYLTEGAVAVYEGSDGDPVGLWPPTRSSEPYDWLVMQFDSWVVLLNCYPHAQSGSFPQADPEGVAVWAASMDARAAEDGFLVFTPRPPLRLHGWGFNVGPTLRFSFGVQGRDNRIVEIGLEGCDIERSWDRDGNQGVAQWCVAPGIRIYALGEPSFLDTLVAGLEIRNFERG